MAYESALKMGILVFTLSVVGEAEMNLLFWEAGSYSSLYLSPDPAAGVIGLRPSSGPAPLCDCGPIT